MSVIFYIVGGVIRAVLFVVSSPLLLTNALLDLPLLDAIWGVWVWFLGLYGDAGTMALEASRTFIALGVSYAPFYVLRWAALRKQPLVAPSAAPPGR